MRITITFCLLMCTFLVYSQDKILRNTPLSQAEFSVAMNPVDTNNIVLVTMHGFQGIEDSFFSIYYSSDFGRSWNISGFDGFNEDLYVGAGDPVIKFNSRGEAILTGLVATVGFDVFSIIYKSVDGGENWTTEYTGNGDEVDKPWLAIDNGVDSPHFGNVYIPIVDFDSDGINLTRLDTDLNLIGNSNIPDGEQLPSIVINESTGDVFTSNITLDNPNVFYCQQWTNGGRTLIHSTIIDSTEDFTFAAPDISQRYQPTPYLAIDNSGGPYNGRLYFSYTASEVNNAEYFDVNLTWSDDNGFTWSEPKPIHSDLRGIVQQFYSSSYVTDNGTLLLDWYDRTNFEPRSQMTDFFMGISRDGGESFSEIQLTSESMNFGLVADAGFGFGIGEYHGMVATNETAISFWSDGRGTEANQNIYFARVNLSDGLSSVDEFGMINPEVTVGDIYPNPVETKISLSVTTEGVKDISWKIISADGKSVQEGKPQKYSAGKHQMNIDIDLLSGAYTFLISADGLPVRSQVFVKK